MDEDTTSYHSLAQAFDTYLQDDSDEKNRWLQVTRAYRQYAAFLMEQCTARHARLMALPSHHQAVAPTQDRAQDYKNSAICNQYFLDSVLKHAGQEISQELRTEPFCADDQMSKVSSVLKSVTRDWSAAGQPERDLCYTPLIERVRRYLPKKNKRLCVPGAGLGRLACELATVGYKVQGNECSLHMLLASDFVLNGPGTPMRLCPYILESRNVMGTQDPFRIVTIPDKDPYQMICGKHRKESAGSVLNNDFSMAAGDFCTIYDKDPNAWDAVVACYFLDATPSVIETLLTMYNMLVPGGYLISFGPLLWHWSGPAMRPDDHGWDAYRARYHYLDDAYMESVDWSWEDVRKIMINVGFEIVEESTGHESYYTHDPASLMCMKYNCVLVVARKPVK